MQRPAGVRPDVGGRSENEDGGCGGGAGSWLIAVVPKLPTVVTLKVLPAGDRR